MTNMTFDTHASLLPARRLVAAVGNSRGTLLRNACAWNTVRPFSMARRRIDALSRHLTSANLDGDSSLQSVQPREMFEFLTRDNLKLRLQIMDFLKDDLYKPNHYLSLMEFREQTLQRLKKFCEQRFFSVADYTQDPLKFQAGLEVLALCDYSLSIKAGVHFTLCGGAIAKLGTQKHFDALFDRLDTLDLPGCFGMTELGHGSNVLGIQTQATYDADSQEFIIHTPSDTASKFWIGGAAQHGKVCTVFAQLTVGGKWEGPHVFVVRLRDDNGKLIPGVRIRDNGPKAGLNGVDNGQIWFDQVRIPRDALLDKFASVAPDGSYSSSIPSLSTRFGVVVGGLTTGRMLIGQGAIDACKIGVTIATRYACARPQFGSQFIMGYLTHQRRLLPALACAYGLHLTMLRLKALLVKQRSPADAKQIHVMSSGLKAGATWSRVEILQACRECCGGQGFSAANRIGPLKNDMDVDVTFEGDNTVMMQQVAKDLIEQAGKAGGPPSRPSIPLAELTAPESLLKLLQYRQQALAAQIAGAMGAASKAAAAQGKKAAAAAATQAYDDHIDLAVGLGWAYVEALCYQVMLEEAEQAPSSCRPALRTLAVLYGATRVERSLSFFLGCGAIEPCCMAALRDAVNRLCRELSEDGGLTLVKLCDGFGIPDHLLQAPIAFDWRLIGADVSM